VQTVILGSDRFDCLPALLDHDPCDALVIYVLTAADVLDDRAYVQDELSCLTAMGFPVTMLPLDGARIERVEALLGRARAELTAARDWLTVYQLPAYAHELNPVEPLWSHLKRSLANLAQRNLAQLTALVKTRLKRMQYRPGLLGGFLAGTGLDLTPFL
jgi:putative transposase